MSRVIKVDSSKNRWLYIDLRLRDLHTFLMYRDDHETDHLSGRDVSQDASTKFVARYLQNDYKRKTIS